MVCLPLSMAARGSMPPPDTDMGSCAGIAARRIAAAYMAVHRSGSMTRLGMLVASETKMVRLRGYGLSGLLRLPLNEYGSEMVLSAAGERAICTESPVNEDSSLCRQLNAVHVEMPMSAAARRMDARWVMVVM